jgi:hypothetical protein
MPKPRDSTQEDVINCATNKRPELATKKVPYPTPAHKIFDGIPSNKKVKKAVHTGNKLLLSNGADDKKKKKRTIFNLLARCGGKVRWWLAHA